MLVSSKASQQIEALVKSPTGHAYVLVGDDIDSLRNAARQLTAGWMQISKDAVAEHPYIKEVVPDQKGTISIDEVRKLLAFCRLKVLSRSSIQRVIILYDAPAMTHEAQNSLLKLLEEPPAGTMIILTATDIRALMSTVRSRVQAVELLQPNLEELLRNFIPLGYKEDDIKRAFALHGASLRAITAFLAQSSDTETPIAVAKRLLGSSKYEKLSAVDLLAKDKAHAAEVVSAMVSLSSSAVTATASDPAKLVRWHAILQSCAVAEDALQKNTNAKLVLTELFMKI